VVLDVLKELIPTMSFKDDTGNVIYDKWHAWKCRHRFSLATWDFLLKEIPSGFLYKRLANEGKNKRAEDYFDKFPNIVPILDKFLNLKY